MTHQAVQLKFLYIQYTAKTRAALSQGKPREYVRCNVLFPTPSDSDCCLLQVPKDQGRYSTDNNLLTKSRFSVKLKINK